MEHVKNINGTSKNKCKCGTWLKHWENITGDRANACGAYGCQRTDLDGAHVQKADSNDNRWYIVPLCGAHNKSPNDLWVTYRLASANVQETCGR